MSVERDYEVHTITVAEDGVTPVLLRQTILSHNVIAAMMAVPQRPSWSELELDWPSVIFCEGIHLSRGRCYFGVHRHLPRFAVAYRIPGKNHHGHQNPPCLMCFDGREDPLNPRLLENLPAWWLNPQRLQYELLPGHRFVDVTEENV